MRSSALLIIDMQLGVFMRKNYDGMALYKEEALLFNVAGLIDNARQHGVPIIYIQHMYKDFPLMEKGQPMWQIHPAIAPQKNDYVVEKHHADAFYDTHLDSLLNELNATRLYITGIETAYCVDTTCRRAHSMGYDCVWVADGHSTLDSDHLPAEKIIAHHNDVIGSQFAKVMKTADILL